MYPDPDPPTIAIFLPAGIVNDNPFNIGFPGTYSNFTLSNSIVDDAFVMCIGFANSLFCKILLYIKVLYI